MIKAVVFDLDGVILSTDMFHFKAWKRMADEEGIYFDININDRLRGISRMESLEVVLEKASKEYSQSEKEELATRKNEYYKEYLQELTKEEIFDGINELIANLKSRNIFVAIGSSSKNTALILKKVGLDTTFDVIVDGNDIKNSKPDPEVFLLAAKRLDVLPEQCLVIEDAVAGVQAAISGGMNVFAINCSVDDEKVLMKYKSSSDIKVKDVIKIK